MEFVRIHTTIITITIIIPFTIIPCTIIIRITQTCPALTTEIRGVWRTAQRSFQAVDHDLLHTLLTSVFQRVRFFCGSKFFVKTSIQSATWTKTVPGAGGRVVAARLVLAVRVVAAGVVLGGRVVAAGEPENHVGIS